MFGFVECKGAGMGKGKKTEGMVGTVVKELQKDLFFS